jgi:Rrf2 family protein
MKMSTRGRYGLRAMLELGRCFGDEPLLMATLAEREGLSRKYLHTLLTGLKSAGLVRSVRGAGGGFVLARDPSEITLAEILYALEGSLSLVSCVADERVCDRTGGCTAHQVWQELSGAIEGVIDNVTLGDMIRPGYSASSTPRARKSSGKKKPGPRKKAGRSTTACTRSRSQRGGADKS